MRPRRFLLYAALAVAVLRFLMVVHAGVSYWDGDFLQTMPGPHVERLNPVLWNSPYLTGTPGHDRFIYGPTQHLTLLPLMLIDDFAAIARLLLAIEAGLMVASVFLLVATFSGSRAASRELLPLVAIATAFFPPAMQALLQREFEVVIFFGFNLAAYWLVKGREGRAGAVLGYITWFKYFPLVTFTYLLARRRWSSAAGYMAVSGLILAAAGFAFGLESFGRTATRAQGFLGTIAGADFCAGWGPADQTSANLQWGLCTLSKRWTWLPARWLFFSIVTAVSLVAIRTFLQFERLGTHRPDLTRWRTICELSLLAIAMSFAIHNHYHYLILLLFPLSALVASYWIDGRFSGPWGWSLSASYVLLGAFVTSPTVFTRYFEVSGWDVFAENVLYLYGGLILLVLILLEYRKLAACLKVQSCEPDDKHEDSQRATDAQRSHPDLPEFRHSGRTARTARRCSLPNHAVL